MSDKKQVPQQADKQQQKSSQLHLKSIQPQDELRAKVRERPSVDLSEKDQVKKKRNLLSFGEDFEEASPQKKDKIKRADASEKGKKKFEYSKQIGKKTIEEDLKQQFKIKIQKLKQEMFQFDYSYWDGPLVVKKLKRKKKQSIKSLLQVCRLQLIANFQNLATVPVQDLLMVVKDFILPHKMTIAQLQALQLKTTKGDCLLNFKNVKIKDLTLSVNVEGPLRVIQKTKYEKNVAAYPFNTWQKMNID